MDIITRFLTAQPPALMWGLAGVGAVLALGAVIAALLTVTRRDKNYTELRQRIASWVVMIGLLSAALLAGWQATTLLFMVALLPAVVQDHLSCVPTPISTRGLCCRPCCHLRPS